MVTATKGDQPRGVGSLCTGESSRWSGLRARVLLVHETDDWVTLMDCSNSTNAALAEMATSVPVLTTLLWPSATARDELALVLRMTRGSTGRSLAPKGCSKGALWDR